MAERAASPIALVPMRDSLSVRAGRPSAARGTIALAALLVLGGGCHHDSLDPIGPDAGTAARERWAQNRPANYDFTLTRYCFCLAEVVRPVVIEVRGGVVQSRTYAATGLPVAERWASYFPTMDGLLAEVDSASKNADRMQATYDRQYGYLSHANIDFVSTIANDEVELTVNDFHPLP